MKIAVFVMAIMVMCICPGRISEEKDLVLGEQKRPKNCRSPKGNHGFMRNDGCIQSTCTNGKWKPKMRTDICCYKQRVHKPNTVMDKIVSADNCSSTTVGCGAVAQLEFNHKSCSTPSSKQQVDKMEINLEQKIEQVENLAKTSGKQNEEIYKTVKEADKKVISIEDKVNDLKNTSNWQSEKVNHVIQKIENNKISIENHVNDLSDKIQTLENNMDNLTQMSLQMMRKMVHLTKMMEKHVAVEGVLITGGSGAQTSTELFLPLTGKTCSLQSLPDKRYFHSLDVVSEKIIMCGGYDTNTRTSCLEFLPTSSTGSWANYATLEQYRYGHTTHVFQEDMLILGGGLYGDYHGIATTEIIGKGTGYNLQQGTGYACSIPDGSSTILTGGQYRVSNYLYGHKTVVRYNMQGFVGNLPDLATARYRHGCGSYMDNGNKVMVVAGGEGGVSSTELLLAGARAWTFGESLPRTLRFLTSANMDGYLLLIGGNDGSTNRGEVLKFDGTWTEVGMMKNARSSAGATKIEIHGEGGFLDISACY